LSACYVTLTPIGVAAGSSAEDDGVAVPGQELGRLLVLLHDVDLVLGSFNGEFRDWMQPTPTSALVVDADDAGTKRVRWRDAGPFSRPIETRRRIWFEQPDRVRVEIAQGKRLLRLAVRDGDAWWRWDHVSGTDSGPALGLDGQPSAPPLLDPPLLSPAALIARFRFEPPSVGDRLGRKVLVALGRLRRPPQDDVTRSFEFEFDARRGVVLRRAAFENSRCVQCTEALAVRFDAPVDARRFVFDPP
jgi:hypothetical protein